MLITIPLHYASKPTIVNSHAKHKARNRSQPKKGDNIILLCTCIVHKSKMSFKRYVEWWSIDTALTVLTSDVPRDSVSAVS